MTHKMARLENARVLERAVIGGADMTWKFILEEEKDRLDSASSRTGMPSIVQGILKHKHNSVSTCSMRWRKGEDEMIDD